MKIKETVTKENLFEVGFQVPTTNEKTVREDYQYLVDKWSNEECLLDYTYLLGYSRRGQNYFLVVKDRELSIIATEPDGSGGACELDDIFTLLYSKNYIE